MNRKERKEKKRRNRLLALLLSLCMLLTMFPVTAFAADENEVAQTADGDDVLMFSTRMTTSKWDENCTKQARINIPQVFTDAGYKVKTKMSNTREQHLTEADMEGIGLLILFFPYVSLNDSDIALMREFLQGGGRIVMIGEHGKFSPTENTVLSQVAGELGGSFTISTQSVGKGGILGYYEIQSGSAQMPDTALTEGIDSLICNVVAPISYTGSVQPVLYYQDSVWAVDQAAENGRIFAISDINCFDCLWLSNYKNSQVKKDTKTWILNWLLDARDNQRIVLDNRDPNLGFGGSPIVSVDVGADDHISIAGDYSFTVTYTGSDESENGVIDTATIGTDDVMVRNENGEELLINHAEIISGANSKELTVRYTVEAQQTDYFTPGDYTISVVNASVADKAGKQVGGKTAATFTVIDLPVEITGPENVSIPKEGSASLSVSARVADSASDFGPFTYSYQWYRRNGSSYEKIDGANEASYDLPESVTGSPGQYTYRCECKVTLNDDSSVLVNSKDAVVTVQRGIGIGTPTATEQNGAYILSAELLDDGSETIVETGFVWGIMGSPTISLNNGNAQTSAPVLVAGSTISVTATELAAGVSYYARAYAKTAGGNVVYSAATSFGSTGELGTFSVKNNGNNTFTVTLSGGKGEQMVFYRTVNGSAVGGTHFEHACGVLVFKEGETSKTITVTEHGATATYGGNVATGYSNADRTYSLELYRTMGGASIAENGSSAVRTMTKSDAYTVDRNIYTDWILGYFDTGTHRIDDSGWQDIFSFYAGLPKKFTDYLKVTATDYQFYFVLECHEVDDGYQYMRVLNTNGNAEATNWEIKSGSRADSWRSGAYFPSSTATGSMNDIVSQNWVCTGSMSWVKDASREYLNLATNTPGTTIVSFDAGGKGDDDWEWRNLEHYYRPGDTREPTLLAVAPMAQTAYAAGESVTVALIFDEIVDAQNSTLENVSIETNLGTLSYAGGADTNVLYFTGTMGVAFNGGEIQVTKINGTDLIKDMAEAASSTATPADSQGNSPITLAEDSVPTVTISEQQIADSVASAKVTAANADALKYCWTESAAMPAAGWMTADSSTDVTLTGPVTEAGDYYLHVMAINTTSGNAAYASTTFTVAAENLIYLTASADNSRWAQSRSILLETGGEGTLTVKKPDGTTEEIDSATSAYTVIENGDYVFTFASGGKTVTKTVTVERIDRTSPVVGFGELPSGWQAEFPELSISGNDGTGESASGIASLKYKLVTERGAYPADGLTEVTLTDGAASDWKIDGTGAVNGINYIYYIAEDEAGNITQGYSSAIKLDTMTPTITVSASVSEGSAAMFEVTATYGASGGTVTFAEQNGNTIWPVSGTAESDGNGGYTFTATPGAGEEGTYVFTVTTGAGKTAQVEAPAICRVTLHAGEGSFDPEASQVEDGDPEDDSGNTSTWLVVSGGTVVPPEADTQQAPMRTGYTLSGWYTDESLETEYDSSQTVTSDLILYAGWELETYKIQYTLNGGSFAEGGGNPDAYTIVDGDITLKDPQKEGAIFLGWSGTDLEETTRTVVIATGSKGDREYTANWAEVAVSMEGWTYGDTAAEPVLDEGSNPGSAKVTYTYYTDSACTKETATADGADTGGGKPSYAGTYYVKADVAAADGYNAASGTCSFTIEKKEIGLEWGTSEFTYTGTEQAPAATATGLVNGDACTVTVVGAKINANEKDGSESYTAKATGLSNDNYKLPSAGRTKTFVIQPAGLAIKWSDTTLIYNGQAQKPKAAADGAVNGETVAVSVSGEQVEANKGWETYTAKASVADKNYVIKSGETTDFTIAYLTVGEGDYTLSGTEGENGWYISDVTVIPSEGYSIGESLNGVYTEKQVLTESTDSDYKIYLKNEAGQMTDDILIGEIKIDKEDPEITASGNTADYLQSDTVEITAADNISGVAKVEVRKNYGEFADITASYKDGYTVAENGIYTFRITDQAGHTAETSLTYSKVDTVVPIATITAVTNDGEDYADGSWTNQSVTLTVQNTAKNLGTTTFRYKVDGGEWQDYTDPILVSDDTDADGITYTFQAISASGVESKEQSITVKRDTVSPDGDIAIEENSVKQFFNNITFGLFFNRTVDVAITGTDGLSGVKSIQYYRTDEILTEEQVKALTEWTDYHSLSETAVDAERFIYYVKVTDHAGNQTCFASNGTTFDLTKPVIDGVVDGGTYYTTQKVVVTDVNLDSITLDKKPAEGTFLLAGDVDWTYQIVAVDLAGNETVVTVTMKPISSMEELMDDLSVDNVTSDDRTVIDEVLDQIRGENTENATDQEKEALQKLLDDGTELLDKINDIEGSIDDVIEGINRYDKDKVSPEDKEAIEKLIEEAKRLLETGNLTEEERILLSSIIKDGEELLVRIEEIEQAARDRAEATGDQSNLWLWAVLALLSGGMILTLQMRRRRRR